MPDPAALPIDPVATPAPVRVLVVDDHAAVRAGVARLLEGDPGFVVVGQAADGQEGLDAARRLVPDVVLLDLSMPLLAGTDALPRLLDLPSPPAVVLFTAWADHPRLESAMGRVGVGLGVLTLAGVAGVAAASQGVLPAGETPTSTTAVQATVPVPLMPGPPATAPPTSAVRIGPATGRTSTSRPASTRPTAPAGTAGTTATSVDDHGGRSGSDSGPGSDSSRSGSSGSRGHRSSTPPRRGARRRPR